MSLTELLSWQWATYPDNHRHRGNLLVHIVAVPLFLIGNVGLVVGLSRLAAAWVVLSLIAMLVALALQGKGHRYEAQPPKPFTGIGNALSRIFFEQWVTFPRFVISGAWYRALSEQSSANPARKND